MDGKTVSIELEVDVESEISGLARNGAGPARPFSGGANVVAPAAERRFLLFAGGVPADEQVAALVAGYLGRLTDTLAPYDAGTRYANFVESTTELENIFPADTLRRLEAVKAHVDPNGLFQANHEIHS